MKGISLFLIALGLLGNTAALADQKLAFACKGTAGDMAYLLKIYQGYGYEGFFVLNKVQNGSVLPVYTGPAHGGTYSECGTRTIPCGMIENSQFSVQAPAMIFTMIKSLDLKIGQGDLAIYGNGFSSSETAVIKFTCLKN